MSIKKPPFTLLLLGGLWFVRTNLKRFFQKNLPMKRTRVTVHHHFAEVQHQFTEGKLIPASPTSILIPNITYFEPFQSMFRNTLRVVRKVFLTTCSEFDPDLICELNFFHSTPRLLMITQLEIPPWNSISWVDFSDYNNIIVYNKSQ